METEEDACRKTTGAEVQWAQSDTVASFNLASASHMGSVSIPVAQVIEGEVSKALLCMTSLYALSTVTKQN